MWAGLPAGWLGLHTLGQAFLPTSLCSTKGEGALCVSPYLDFTKPSILAYQSSLVEKSLRLKVS